MNSYCMECHFCRTMEVARPLGDDATAQAFAKELMQLYIDAPDYAASPYFGPGTADLLRKYYGLAEDPYVREKIDSNRFVVERMEDIRSRVQAREDPVFAGLQFAIMGNYLDFSALKGNVSFEKLEDMLASALEMELDTACYEKLCGDLKEAKKLLFLTDNAGEIGFDRIFAEEIQKKYPHLEIVFCVRGGPAANDATREDAKAVGVPFPVIDNGTRIGGTQLELMSKESREAFEEADVIIAKGMGNCETLWGCGYNVYYGFLVKCDHFIRLFDKPLFTPMLVRDYHAK